MSNVYFSDKLVITPDGNKVLTYRSRLVFWDLKKDENTLLNDINHPCFAADISPGKGMLDVDNTIISSDKSKVLDFRYHKLNFLCDIQRGTCRKNRGLYN